MLNWIKSLLAFSDKPQEIHNKLESESSSAAKIEESMNKLGAELNSNPQIKKDADLLLSAMEEFYEFGDETYSPDIIYKKASEMLGFEPNYVKKLLFQLGRSGVIKVEYDPDPNIDPRDSFDFWRVIKNT